MPSLQGDSKTDEDRWRLGTEKGYKLLLLKFLCQPWGLSNIKRVI